MIRRRLGIRGRRRAVYRTGEEKVECAETCRRPAVDMENRILFRAGPAPFSPISIIVVVLALCRCPEAATEHASRCTGRDSDEFAP
jgi:hypothetical protein